ncbi:MAG: heme ABC transporter ATP-binding protein [Thiomicrospira sp.]|uniref:heme ABC transporter ATP-binding protein n=1 Tax=Thiomicrospira sp. TaxID=935 RepID=UPI0019FF5D0F|nr:heme ABC transporter ATP-binding protein [Thiomicrospira sp.]MBE0493548.1 heme ABC transporter ATP-binding protein [Thiomicrospira sp.]
MLEIESIDYAIGDKTILSHVGLQVKAGELWVILGPNGAGKSTLLNVLSGELSAFQSQVCLNQQPLTSYTPIQLARLRAVMPQSVGLEFGFWVKEVVALGLLDAPRDQIENLVKQALALFDVSHLAQRNYLTLSGGEKQRTHLARVMAQILSPLTTASARFLLLDECTSNLDLAHQQQVFKVLKQCAREQNMGVVAVLHDLNLASQFADQALLLHEGAVYASGRVETVLTQANIEAVYQTPVEVIERPNAWRIIVPSSR